ncbi:uncharacterized protein LOC120450496 [Drosophila santomea]|uniref:uncharacterized protein LOC120450495 n=1 Tax=Drosophila santomea TaxID=129105 RepID=UPI001954CA87|nr:uncharacterized protein LOC120450495 [Drosophila santomea]XP_039489477.1 uncharacterized protein LOC120450496 [Drosophila santomea]
MIDLSMLATGVATSDSYRCCPIADCAIELSIFATGVATSSSDIPMSCRLLPIVWQRVENQFNIQYFFFFFVPYRSHYRSTAIIVAPPSRFSPSTWISELQLNGAPPTRYDGP